MPTRKPSTGAAPTDRTTAAPGAPTFRALTPDECHALLARHQVGRIAYTFHDRVSIEPIHYAFEDGWIYGRTSRGSKLDTLAHHRWVAFEVDEVRGVFDWSSVVVHGGFYTLAADGPPAERGSRERALHLLDAIVPGTLTPDDPVPFRDVVFHVHVDEITGRQALPPAAPPSA